MRQKGPLFLWGRQPVFVNIAHNYETTPLNIQSPDNANLIIFLIVLIVSFYSFKKKSASSDPLNKNQTDQLKGIAIVCVIIGHIWVHVSKNSSAIILSGDAVALFFLLSGYGLTISLKNKSPHFKSFVLRRARRVMIPYWIATCLILTLDYLVLQRTYSFNTLMLTSLGVNITVPAKQIDYVRWYITLLMLWYALFFVAFSRITPQRRIAFLVGCALLIYLFDYYFMGFGWYQIFAFPAGCAFGFYYNKISVLFQRSPRPFFLSAAGMLCYVLFFKIFLSPVANASLPSIIYKLLMELISIIFCVAAIIFVAYAGLKKYQSSLLQFCGKISYELFLIHGAFLVKYNPIMMHTTTLLFITECFLFIVLMLILSWLLQKFIRLVEAG